MPPAPDATILRMRAANAGFEIGPVQQPGDWLEFRSAGNLATLWLKAAAVGYLAAAAPSAVAGEVREMAGSRRRDGDLPVGAVTGWWSADDLALDLLCRRIAVLGHVLPDQVYRRFQHEAAAAAQAAEDVGRTERIAQVRQRVGQDLFREALMDYWGGRCAVTGVAEAILLRASHAKPWKDASDRERLDVHNGLLLVANLDAAFDAGLITVGADWSLVVCAGLGAVERKVLGVDMPIRVKGLTAGHEPYLEWHRREVFRRVDV
jgi:putative restriction endonuclease